jgi:hypothetical protein
MDDLDELLLGGGLGSAEAAAATAPAAAIPAAAAPDARGAAAVDDLDELLFGGPAEAAEAAAPDAPEALGPEGRMVCARRAAATLKLPGPLRRTPEQHHYICSRMREGKLRAKVERRAAAHKSAMEACMEAVKPFVMRSKVQLRVSKNKRDGEMIHVDVIGSGGGKQLFTWETMVNIAYEKPMPKTTLAEMYNASRQTIGRVISGVALAFSSWQRHVLGSLLDLFRVKPPSVVVACWMWDETSERVALQSSVPGITSQQAGDRTW